MRRRYQDFLWLVDRLKDEFPERLIPPLPDKNRLEYLGRFTPDFIKRRQLGLKRFLIRIDSHPWLGRCDVFLNFLRTPIVGMGSASSNLLKNRCNSESSLSASVEEPSGSSSYLKPVIDGLGDVLQATSLFSRSLKDIPEEFVKLRKEVKMIKGHLSQLERLFSARVFGHQPAIIEGMKEIAGNFDELSASIDLSLSSQQQNNSGNDSISPPFVKSMLSRVSATMTQCAHLMDKSIDDQELNLLAVLLEYCQYCDSALEIIEARDRRQVEVEELTKLISGYEKEIEELEGVKIIEGSDDSKASENCEKSEKVDPPPLASSTATTSNVFSYLSSKWDSWKGVDPITARKNRLTKCQTKLSETRKALKISSELLGRFDTVLGDEIGSFIDVLKAELGKEFENHGSGQIKYHETNLVYWSDFVDWLDNPPRHL